MRGSAGRGRPPLNLDAVETTLSRIARNQKRAGNILRFEVDDVCFTLFGDGRALIEGTDDIDRALALYDRYVGA